MLKQCVLSIILAVSVYIPAAQAQGATPSDGVFNVKLYGATGDGATDDYLPISVALTDAAKVGGTVYFPTGTYVISKPLTPGADVTLAGTGRKSSFIKPIAYFSQNGTSLIEVGNGADRVQVRDLGFLSNNVAQSGVKMLTVQDALVERCWFDGGFYWSVFIGSSSRACRVTGIISEGTTVAHNVEINDSSYCEVSNNHLQNSHGNGVEVYINTPGECAGNRIIGNFIESPRESGILLSGDSFTTVVGNTVKGAGTSGFIAHVGVLGPQYPSSGGQLVSNTFLDNGGTSNNGLILSSDSRSWTIKGNTVKGSANIGIYVSGVAHTVEGNIVTENARHGIYVASKGHVIANNTCSNNSTLGAGVGDGIRVETSGCSLTGNRCTDTRATKLQYFGIALIGGGGHTLTANITNGNLNVGIYDASTGSIKTGNI
jgi:parallel beta-helix repeat protein